MLTRAQIDTEGLLLELMEQRILLQKPAPVVELPPVETRRLALVMKLPPARKLPLALECEKGSVPGMGKA